VNGGSILCSLNVKTARWWRGIVGVRTLARAGRMTVTIGRRELPVALGGAAAVWPLVARAQQPAKLSTIGLLGAATLSTTSPWVAAFLQRLRDFGWVEGRNIAIEYRWAEGRSERYAEIAAEFVRLKVDVIVRHSTPPVVAAKQATSVIPIGVRECKRYPVVRRRGGGVAARGARLGRDAGDWIHEWLSRPPIVRWLKALAIARDLYYSPKRLC